MGGCRVILGAAMTTRLVVADLVTSPVYRSRRLHTYCPASCFEVWWISWENKGSFKYSLAKGHFQISYKDAKPKTG